MKTVRFQFDIEVDDEQAQKMTAHVLQWLAGQLVVLTKLFPNLSKHVHMQQAKLVLTTDDKPV